MTLRAEIDARCLARKFGRLVKRALVPLTVQSFKDKKILEINRSMFAINIDKLLLTNLILINYY